MCIRDRYYPPWVRIRGFLAEITLEQVVEALAVTGLVLAHLMHGVMDGVQVELLGQRGQLLLAGGRAPLGLSAQLKVLLGRGGHNLTQQLGELGGMLGLFPGICLLYTSRCV